MPTVVAQGEILYDTCSNYREGDTCLFEVNVTAKYHSFYVSNYSKVVGMNYLLVRQ